MKDIMIEVSKTELGNINFLILQGSVLFSLRVHASDGLEFLKELKRIVADLEAMNEAK
jgi:hypothetical protein